jgi:hypothetical protein
MGGEPYWYFVPYQEDVMRALQELRAREFEAGRYNPVIWCPEFPITDASPAPGRQHATIDEAVREAEADGTRSILDIMEVGPRPDFNTAFPLSVKQLETLYGVAKPSREQVEKNLRFLDLVDRGQCAYFVLYADGAPSEIVFGGISFD